MITYATHAKALIDNGYNVVPLYPHAKNPVLKEWQHNLNPDPSSYTVNGIGIACGVGEYSVYAIDIDITNSEVCGIFIDKCKAAGLKMFRIGMAPKAMFLYRGAEGMRKTQSKSYECGKIERLGMGQQFAAYGIHPVTNRPYQWPIENPVNLHARYLPVLQESFVKDLYDELIDLANIFELKEVERDTNLSEEHEYDPTDPLDQKEPLGVDLSRLAKMVNSLDPDCSRDRWRNVGMALHHETEGSEEGFDIWDEWSQKGTKYKDGETRYYWDKFGNYTGEPLTAAYILKLAKKDEPEEEPVDENFFNNINWNVDRFLDEPPSIDMVIEKMMPKGITSLLYSAGGAGKSTIVLSMAVRIALADIFEKLTFLGRAVHGGEVVILTAEDPDHILNRRYIATVEALATELGETMKELRPLVERNLKILSTFGNSVHLFNIDGFKGVLKKTKYYDQLLERLKTLKNLKLIVIDTKTRYSPGEGEGNVLATQEITFYENIAQTTGATVMLLHHSNKKSRGNEPQTGATAYRDASAIFDSVRAAWYFRPLTDGELAENNLTTSESQSHYVLENSKNNYIKEDVPILVSRSGYTYTAGAMAVKLPKGQAKEIKAEAARNCLITYMQQSSQPIFSQATLVQVAKDEAKASRNIVATVLAELQEDGIVEVLDESKKARAFRLTPEGELFSLTLDSDK